MIFISASSINREWRIARLVPRYLNVDYDYFCCENRKKIGPNIKHVYWWLPFRYLTCIAGRGWLAWWCCLGASCSHRLFSSSRFNAAKLTAASPSRRWRRMRSQPYTRTRRPRPCTSSVGGEGGLSLGLAGTVRLRDTEQSQSGAKQGYVGVSLPLRFSVNGLYR